MRRRANEQGSVLVVALLLAAGIALCLGSYLALNAQSTRLAKRTFYGYAALNLGEAGAEQAVWSFNRAAGGATDGWDGWTKSAGAATRRLTGFSLAQNTGAAVQVYVDNYQPSGNSSTSKLVSLATVTPANDADITRMIEVTVKRRSLFANGLVGRESVVFNGSNASVDSWNSDPDNSPATPAVAYDPSIRRDRGSVASTAIGAGSVIVNQANIWGYAYTGGAQPSVGTNGTIRGEGTAATVKVDPARIATDFAANLNTVGAPADGTSLAQAGAVLGVAGTATKWRIPSISLTGNSTLTILGDVTIILTNTTGTALSVGGNASIVLTTGSTLTLYVEADVQIAGNGIYNGNAQPISTTIWGTKTTASQDIKIAGNGALKAVVYAPNGKITINGNGDVMGAFVGQTVTLTGNASFHYDESLQQYGTSSYGISSWRELTSPADRAQYQSVFNGW